MKLWSIFLTALTQLSLAFPAVAQHPIDVQRLYVQGSYYEALLTYEKMPKRTRTMAAEIAAGKSAWALSLPDRSLDVFQKALRDESISDHERYWLLFSRAVISYQEDRFEEAIAYADSALQEFPKDLPITARLHVLKGQALSRLDDYVQALHHYETALTSCAPEEAADIHYLMGLSFFRIGKLNDARQHLEQLPNDHSESAAAVRMLVFISLENESFEEAEHWLNKGVEFYPETFLDSWSDYARLKIAIAASDRKAIKTIVKDSREKYPPSDSWLAMISATAEMYHWKQPQSFKQTKSKSDNESAK